VLARVSTLAPAAAIRHNPQTLKIRCKSGLAALTLLCVFPAVAQMLPAPRTPSAEGKQPPDFTLTDQSGKPFHLAAMREQPILLIFYRGYW
jgi:cytochrome oxidase Cu insertion factor (SCO1/SenC/PrrC family)